MSLYHQLEILKAAAKAKPERNSALEILSLVKQGPPYDELFFTQLSDSSWLSLLSSEGFFSKLPEAERQSDANVVYKHHVPLIGLAQLAKLAPRDVTNVLIKLNVPDNPVVGDQVLRCIAPIRDKECISLLSPLVVKLTSGSPQRTTGIWLNELLKVWVEAGALSDSLAVVRAYLSATIGLSDDIPLGSGDWLLREINREVFERLTAEYPQQVVEIFFHALQLWAEKERKREAKGTESLAEEFDDEPDSEQRPFTYWLEDFKSASESHREIEGTLAFRLFEATQKVYQSGDRAKIADLDQLLRSDTWQLFTRLRWQLYADFPAVSLKQARRDVVERIPKMNLVTFGHNYEFAELLKAHAETHGFAFLSGDEVAQFFEVVCSGPLDRDGVLIEDEYRPSFRRKQLAPISDLLRDEHLAAFRALGSQHEIDTEDYKPFRSGGGARFVEHVAPKEANSLDSMALPELWDFLNRWQPDKNRFARPGWWIEEDVDALAAKFAELVERQPDRFDPESKWWENLKRPPMLHKVLERASERISKKSKETASPSPTELDWANWFGVATWIASRRPIKAKPANRNDEESNWVWPRIIVAKFLKSAIGSDHGMPSIYFPRIAELLRDLIEQDDPRLEDRSNARLDDWLTTAINSVRGDAVDALLNLALSQKKSKVHPETWIFDLIWERLGMPHESPAISALIGARLRLFVHLFGDKLRTLPDRLFCADKPIHRDAAIVAHFTYDHPMTAVLDAWPTLPAVAIETLANMQKVESEDEKQRGRDFGAQLGTHIAFYYWNDAFANEAGEAALDRFFAVAPKETRARLISTIGSIFEKQTEPVPKISTRVMQIWERRYGTIVRETAAAPESIATYERELAEFTDWLQCECFPFAWRYDHVMAALRQLKVAPRAFQLLETIANLSKTADRLPAALRILLELLSRPSNELRWSIQAKQLSPILSKGLASSDLSTRQLAEEVRDLLLKLGFFEFLDVAKS